jgi:outer membrane protein assembly factor BamB
VFLCTVLLAPTVAGAADPRHEELWTAARKGDVKTVDRLLARGIDVNAKNEIGITALWLATGEGRDAVVKTLLAHKADANARDYIWYQTPLSNAVGVGKVQIVQALLASGAADVDAALLSAASAKRANVLAALLKSGKIHPEALDAALVLVARDGTESVAVLKKAGAKPPRPAAADEQRAWASLTGTYENENGGKLIIELKDGVLLARPYFGTPYVLKPDGKDRFRAIGHDAVAITFQRAGKDVPRLVLTRFTSAIAYYAPEQPAVSKPADAGHHNIDIDIQKIEQDRHEAEQKLQRLLGASVAEAKPWPSFRGPGASGVADGQHPPTTWDVGRGVNVLWKTPIQGLGHSCPVVWGRRVFVTTAVGTNPDPTVRTGNYGDITSVNETDKHSWQVFCLDRENGRILWRRTACESVPRVKRHQKGSHANCTPATDGRRVVACFGAEGLYCYDFDGRLLWKRDLGALDSSFAVLGEYEWGFGSSPVLYGGLAILQCDLGRDSFIAAYSLEDGRRVWSTPRDEIASWSTPTVWPNSRRVELVTNASQYARGYDPLTGKELWRLAKKSEATIPTPFFGPELVYVASGNRPIQPIVAIRPGASGDISLAEGEETNAHVAWSRMRGGPYMTTPILYGDYLYTCSNAGMLTCYEARTGKEVYKQRMGGTSYTASPVAADGRLYFTSEQGEVRVVAAGPRFRLLAVNKVGDVCMATPAISDGALFVRSQHFLFAFGPKPAPR